MKKLLVIFSMLILLLTGCTQHMGPKEGTGALLGATAGAIAGSNIGKGKGNIAAIAIGAVAGALFGQELGRTLDRADRIAMGQNARYSLEHSPSHETTKWTNPDSGHSGSMTPLQTYQTETGQYCREYQQTIEIGGEIQDAYGTACRQPDGSWEIVSTERSGSFSGQRTSVTQPSSNYPPTRQYRTASHLVSPYPYFLALSVSSYDHHPRSHFGSGKYRRGYNHGHIHIHKEKAWKQHRRYKWYRESWWDDHRWRDGRHGRKGRH